MVAADPATRSLVARIAANTRVAHTTDRKAMTAPARRAWNARWEKEVDPTGSLDPNERAIRAKAALKAHMQGLSLRSSQTRKRRKK
jgi:hypothetical protein